MSLTLSSGGKNPLSDSHKHNIGGTKWGKVLHKWDIKPTKGIVSSPDNVSHFQNLEKYISPMCHNGTPIRKLTVWICVFTNGNPILNLYIMTREEIYNILHGLYITHKEDGDKIKIDFNHGDKRIGHMYYKPNEIVGKRKPIKQKIYVLDTFEMVGVMDYINNISPIQEKDFDIINKSINQYCQEMMGK